VASSSFLKWKIAGSSPLPEEELYGTVKFWGAEMKSGLIQIDDNNRYQFVEADIIRGAATEGASAKFRAVAPQTALFLMLLMRPVFVMESPTVPANPDSFDLPKCRYGM
jgi:hypothetical protein